MAMTFHQRLIHELADLDRRESTRKGHNPYALAHYFRAAESIEEEMTAGASAEKAFSANFCPTRGTHRVARNLGLALDVERGRWVSTATVTG